MVVATELDKLVLPLIPELGKTVQEQYELAVAPRYIMETYTVNVGVSMFERGFSDLVICVCQSLALSNGFDSTYPLADSAALNSTKLSLPCPASNPNCNDRGYCVARCSLRS